MGMGKAGVVAVALAMAAAGCGRELAPGGGADTRVAVHLTVTQRDLVLIEMRTMLTSLQQIIAGSAAGDTAAIRRAAVEAGTRHAADLELGEELPPEFLRLGMSTHQWFDGLAAAVDSGVPRDTILARLGAITQNCVACHATYRLVPAR